MFVLGLILNGENGYLSLIGVKELNILLKLLFVDVWVLLMLFFYRFGAKDIIWQFAFSVIARNYCQNINNNSSNPSEIESLCWNRRLLFWSYSDFKAFVWFFIFRLLFTSFYVIYDQHRAFIFVSIDGRIFSQMQEEVHAQWEEWEMVDHCRGLADGSYQLHKLCRLN